MDKDKILNDILAEWAMRSPDGLVGGHDTPENIAVLNEILDERRINNPEYYVFDDPKNPGKKIVNGHPLYDDGVPYEDVLSDKIKPYKQGEKEKIAKNPFPQDMDRSDLAKEYFELKYGSWVTKNHPDYPDKTKYNDIKYNRAAKRTSSEKETGISATGAIPYREYKWDYEILNKTKGFNIPSAIKIENALKVLPPALQRDFLKNGYNKLDAAAAVQFVNDRFGVYQKFINALDAARSAGGKTGEGGEEIDVGGAGSKAGRGEFLLVLLIKGGSSAGIESGDIKIEGKKGAIEVKEITGNGFRATKASFGQGGFYRLKYISAINELIDFCNKSIKSSNKEHKTRGDVLKSMCEGKKDSPEDKDFWKNLDPEVKEKTLQFFEFPSLESLNSSAAYGLEAFGAYLRGINEKEAAVAATPNTVEFDLKKHTTTMKIEDMPEPSKEKVIAPTADPQQVTMTVAPITKEDEEETRLVVPAAKRLEFFKFKGKENIYTPQRIAEEMFEAMKLGHYNQGIIFYNESVGFYYEPDLANLKHGTWYFYAYQQTGPFFVRDVYKATEPK